QLEGANLAEGNYRLRNQAGMRRLMAGLKGSLTQGANLADAQLQWANLKGAQLRGASLERAQLQGADLTGATCRSKGQSATAIVDANTKLPETEECRPYGDLRISSGETK